MSRIAGALPLIAGAYVSYYWLRLEFGDKATLADDPVVGFGTRFTARLEVIARQTERAGPASALPPTPAPTQARPRRKR